MAKRQKQWIDSPPRPPKPKVPEPVKRDVETRAHEFVASVLKPKHLTPAPQDADLNDIVDISTKWYHNYFYFCATYCRPGPSAIAPSFETQFARLEYVGNQQFHLSSLRHTGQWWELSTALSVGECFEAIRDELHFLVKQTASGPMASVSGRHEWGWGQGIAKARLPPSSCA